MFTGIISDVGRVSAVERRGEAGDRRIVIETAYETDGIAIGASIACSGACLTVVDKAAGRFAVDVSAETLACTTVGAWEEGTGVNLERALKMGDELGGHMVMGHVDGVGQIAAVRPEGDSLRLEIEPPAPLMPFIAPKGSIAVDGVSLTVNEVGGRAFGVNIIPHTQAETTLGRAAAGTAVNLEVDVLARYVARIKEA